MPTSTSQGAQVVKNVINKNLPMTRGGPILKNAINKNLPIKENRVKTIRVQDAGKSKMEAKNSSGSSNIKNCTSTNNIRENRVKTIKVQDVGKSRMEAKNSSGCNIKNCSSTNNIRENRVNTIRVQDVRRSKMEVKNNIGSSNTKNCTSTNNITLTERRNVKEQIEKWRAERQARLAARILKNKTTKCEVSSSLLGTATPCSTVDGKFSVLSLNPNLKNQQSRQINTTIKKKATIQVRQTTASRLRMNKLNPLHGILSTTRAPSENMKTPTVLSKPSNLTKPGTNCPLPKTGNKLSEKRGIQKHDFISLSSKQSGPKISTYTNVINKTGTFSQKKETNCFTRRSLFQTPSSAKNVHKNITSMPDSIPLEFGSKRLAQKCSILKKALDPLEMRSKQLFMKPDNLQISSGRKKSSVSLFTPDVSRKTMHVQTPCPDVMRERLVNWLAKRGKPIETYRHLCCFGQIPEPKTEASQKRAAIGVGNENISPNVRYPLVCDKPIKQEISLQASDEVDKSFTNKHSQLKKVPLYSNETVENILCDLRKLIISGYPRDQCEAWLHFIMKECKNIDETAVYWECLAALEEARCDFNTAVDYYGRAIMRGAKTENIDKLLDNLWEKFNTLNLDCKSVQNLGSGKKSANKLVDPCQMFKSTVIKFALQQKAVKQISVDLGVEPSSLQYVATPVRRSSRNSVRKYKYSSNIKYVDSLHDLQPDVKNSIVFHTNRALTPKV